MAITLAREFFLPRAELNATKLESKTGHGVVYVWEETKDGKTKILGKGFLGKQNKPDFYNTFNSVERRNKVVAQFLADADASFTYKEERKAKAKAEKAALDCRKDLPIGTILVQSWGWEQTNVDFFQVVEHISRTKLKIQKIGAKTHGSGEGLSSMADHCVADPDFKGEIIEVRQDSKNSIAVPGASGYSWGSSAREWDGKPEYRSWYA